MNKKLVIAIALTTVYYAFIFSITGVLTLLALDVFTLPYLTPFAHFLKVIIMPFVPLIMPLYIAATIKLYKHASFPSRRPWLLEAGCLLVQQLGRVVQNLATLYDWSKLGNGLGFMGMGIEADGFCGLRECKGAWVEAALMVGVVVGESLGWNWDKGYVQKLVDVVVEYEIKKEATKNGDAEREVMEKGEVVVEETGMEVLDERRPGWRCWMRRHHELRLRT